MEDAPASSGGWSLQFSLRRDGWYIVLAAVIVLADQATKWLMSNWLNRGEEWPEGWIIRFVHYTNSGAAFGILQDSGPLLVVASAVGIVAIFVFLFNPGFAHPLMRVGLALMFGGALGNLIDRLAAGEVVDFIKFPGFPAFNVADSAITIGVLCLVWALLFDLGNEEKGESS